MSKGLDPGRVMVRFSIVDDCVATTAVGSERPDIARLLHGQQAEQAVALVPLIYSLCGKAQGIAARAALAAARGAPAAAAVDADALAEAAREHAWQLLVNWPRQLGLDADEALFVRLVRGTAAERAGLAGELAAHRGMAMLRDALRSSAEAGDALLLARVDARLGQLCDFLAARSQSLGTVAASPVGVGKGRASVATARGPLVHELTLEADRIAAYAISAPTDVQFAADGPVANWLVQLLGLPRERALRQAERAVMAYDPCVPWRCEFM